MEVVHGYWPAIILAVVFLIVLAFLVFRPRQRVSLTDSAPVRPHMQQAAPREGRGIAGEAAAATTDLAGDIISAPVHSALEGEVRSDDLCRLKGVGPKFAEALHAAGFYNFGQLAGFDSRGDQTPRPAAWRVRGPHHPRPDRRTIRLPRARRHRRVRTEVREALGTASGCRRLPLPQCNLLRAGSCR